MTLTIPSPCTIRPLETTDADYASACAIHDAAWPEYPSTVEEMRVRDSMRPPHIRHHRFLAEVDGRPVGVGSISHSVWSFDPKQFHYDVEVHPDFRRRGIGSALVDALAAAVADAAPTHLKTWTREDQPDALAMLARRGYVENMRAWESRLALASFDRARLGDLDAKPLSHGIRLTDFAVLCAEEDAEEAHRKLYDMECEVDADVPLPEGETHTPIPYEQWRDRLRKSVTYRPEAFFVAVAPDGTYVGISMLFHPKVGTHLDTGLTGVRRAWRRMGIAQALKLRAVDYALARGASEIRTDNAQQNRPMLSINEAMGFEKMPAWIGFEKVSG